jgi:putative adenylate-forming enzyme
MIRIISDYLRLKHHQTAWDREDIERYQLKRIQYLVNYAKKHSPFYQERLHHLPLQTLEDFNQFPILNKAIMMEYFTSLNTCEIELEDVKNYVLLKEKNKDYLGYYQNQYVIGLSSGTSGNKGIYITDKKMTKRLPGVFLARSGLGIRDLPMNILFCLRVFSQGFDDINAPLIKLNYLSTMTPVDDIILMINTKQINILMAPPSLIRILMPHHEKINVKLKKIVTYAEVLVQEDKKQFEKAFQTKVIEIYQASEGQIASACSHGNLHINEDMVYVELFDRQGNRIDSPHVIGHKMILTNLVNLAQPLIRYEMNDMVVLGDPCPCGSRFRTLHKILGRNDDLIYFLDENNHPSVVFPDLFSRWIITESDLIREFQVIQHEIGRIDLLIDSESESCFEGLSIRLHQELKSLGLKGKITLIHQKIELPKEDHKYKRFISTIKKVD